MNPCFRSGYVAIVGRPNVGKSTFLNYVMEAKLSITTSKPQTTRDRILGIWNATDAQIIFLDTPGIHFSEKALNKYMLEKAVSTITDADLVLVMADPLETVDKLAGVMSYVEQAGKEALLAVNKADLLSKQAVAFRLEELGQVYPFCCRCGISSTSGTGIEELIAEIKNRLPEGPQYFPDDIISDAPERFFCKELIREKAFELMDKEIPYAVAVEIEEFRESDPVFIRAVIHVERQSQKGIIIGSKGRKLKEIGSQARQAIEQHLGSRVFLELFVRVTKDWTKDHRMLKELGYK